MTMENALNNPKGAGAITDFSRQPVSVTAILGPGAGDRPPARKFALPCQSSMKELS